MVARLLLRAELRRGLRAHLAVVAMLAGVAAALTLAAVIGRMAQAPWERTWQATGSPHLTLFGQDRATLEERCASTGRRRRPGSLDTGFVGVHAGRYHVETRLQEMPPPGVGRPAVVEGTADGLLFERSFARRLGVGPGDTVTFDTRSGPRTERITGLAVVYDQDAVSVLPAGRHVRPGRAARRASSRRTDRASRSSTSGSPTPTRRPRSPTGCRRSAGERRETGAVAWQQQREDVGERYESTQIALELLSALLLLCAAPIVATLVSERILARGRELAILRAGGLTPRRDRDAQRRSSTACWARSAVCWA